MRGSHRGKGGTDALNGLTSRLGLIIKRKSSGCSGQKRAAKRRRSSETTQTTST
jgi:hypothetical protein